MKSLLPESDRILLGPGPSLTSPRVMRAMAAPTVGHLDPLMVAMLDDVRAKLTRLFRAPEDSFAFAVSGTGTSGHGNGRREHRQPGLEGHRRRHRLLRRPPRADVRALRRDGHARQRRVGQGGRSVGAREVAGGDAAPTSWRWCTARRRPASATRSRELAAIARKHDALTIVDAVTSFGGVPLDVGAWGIDVCYSCTQKCLGAPSGLAPIVFAPRALERTVKCPSFYFDLQLLRDYWINRKYHHTMSSALLCALYEALTMIEEEGLEARWARHERNHRAFVEGLAAIGLSLLPPEGDRLWTLNTVRDPGRRGRRGRAEAAARGVQHRDRRRPRSAGRQDLARRPDGHQLGVASRRPAARRAAERAGQTWYTPKRAARQGGRACRRGPSRPRRASPAKVHRARHRRCLRRPVVFGSRVRVPHAA